MTDARDRELGAVPWPVSSSIPVPTTPEIEALRKRVAHLEGALRRLTSMLQSEPELRIDYQKVMQDA